MVNENPKIVNLQKKIMLDKLDYLCIWNLFESVLFFVWKPILGNTQAWSLQTIDRGKLTSEKWTEKESFFLLLKRYFHIFFAGKFLTTHI